MNLHRFAFASILLSSATLSSTALAGDNCQNVKDGVTQEWGAVAWGSLGCFSPTPQMADQDGGNACWLLLGQGVIGQKGYREVHLWFGGPPSATVEYVKTYLGYCVGNKPATTLDQGKASEEKKDLDAKMKVTK